MKYLGGNVYVWGLTAQNRLLAEILGPTVRMLHGEGLVEGFWFDRFDARGPHVFFLVSVATGRFEEVWQILAERLRSFLAQQPAREEIPREKIEELHRQTRGKILCPPDEEPGIAARDSFVLFEQPSDGYPFRLAAHLRRPDEFWHLVGDLSLWVIDQLMPRRLQSSATGVSARLAAALDGCLWKAGVARDYWRYHATTLLLGLDERLATAESEVLTWIGAVSAKNRETLTRVWSQVERSGSPWPQLPQLVDVSLAGDCSDRRFLALREAVHCSWKQLGLPSRQHIPLVLFAWHRHLEG